jgi:lipopolysaccharide/colanic/teichoic acid biosynthesis glycosyltransferase
VRRIARALLYGGVIVAVLGTSKVHAAYVAEPPYDFTGSSRFGWAVAYMLLLSVAAYGVGLPDLARSLRLAVVASVAGAGLGAAAISVLQLAVGDALLPRYVVFGAAVVLVPWYLLCALLATGGRSRAEARDLVVVVATGAEGDSLRDELADAERPARVVRVVSLEEARATADGRQPLCAAVAESSATVVVLDREAQADESVVAQAALLHEAGARVRTLSLFYEEWLGKLPVSEVERVSMMFDIGEVHRARYGRVKRLMDLSFGLVAMVPFALAVPVVALGNLVGNRGPLFFSQPRVGKQGRPFRILKFRTMLPGESTGSWTTPDDPRITPFGRLLRRSHLDELPQAVNILRGDLAVVGPRPEQPRYVEELVEKLPFYDLRHLVRPGLTGWAQVKYHYASDTDDALEKLQYEFYYLRHQGLGLDLRIVGRTVRTVLGRSGR